MEKGKFSWNDPFDWELPWVSVQGSGRISHFQDSEQSQDFVSVSYKKSWDYQKEPWNRQEEQREDEQGRHRNGEKDEQWEGEQGKCERISREVEWIAREAGRREEEGIHETAAVWPGVLFLWSHWFLNKAWKSRVSPQTLSVISSRPNFSLFLSYHLTSNSKLIVTLIRRPFYFTRYVSNNNKFGDDNW